MDKERQISLESLWESRNGSSTIEYAFIASLIAMVIIGAVAAVGSNLVPLFNQVLAGF